MDWPLIASVLSGTLGGNVITQVAVQWYGARQRNRERELSKADAHETQLREAYAELLTAELTFEGITDEYIEMLRSTGEKKKELEALVAEAAKDLGLRQELLDQAKQHAASMLEHAKSLSLELPRALENIRKRLVTLHLLESDPARRAVVDVLLNGPLVGMSDDLTALIADRDAHMTTVKRLMTLVAGAFAPETAPAKEKQLKG